MQKRLDILLISVLLIIGGLTHLVNLSQPNQVIFDEVHFGKFVTAYCCNGERFFDIHPPHAKLLIAAAARLGGYTGGFSFDHISQPYENMPVFWFRLMPALMGILLPAIIYILLRQLGARWPLALLGGTTLLFDNALTIQTRIIALDGTLLVATFGSLVAFLAGERKKGLLSWLFFILAGSLAGLAVGSKFTGLAAGTLLGLIILVRLWQQRKKEVWRHWIIVGLAIASSAAIVYLAGWIGHYVLLPNPGFGDAFHQIDLSGAPLPIAFLRDVAELHRVMFSANYNLTATHPYESPWWSWPMMARPVFYWAGQNAAIYFIGNPLVWWGAFILFVIAISTFVIRFGWNKEYNKDQAPRIEIWILITGYIVAMVPLMRVPRALFLYHYLTPLIFSIIVGLLWLELEGVFQINRKYNWQRYLYMVLIIAIIGMFFAFPPLTYGYNMSPAWRTNLLWFKGWL